MTLKFSYIRMQCAHGNQEDFSWVVMWANVREKKWTNVFGNVELIAKKTMEQSTNE